MKQVIIYFSLLISPFALAAEKHLYVMGAGGEPEGKSTIFDKNMKTIGNFAKNSDWKTTISINGGHSKTESIARKGFAGAKNLGSFKKESYEQMLNDMISKLNNGTLKTGDKLMVVIETHGAQHKEGQKTHEIAFSGGEARNLDNLEGAPMTTLDRLEEVVKLAEEKGVKLAIMDLSCYSGNTLNIAGPKTCVISISGTDHSSYNSGPISFSKTFSESMLRNMKEGRNLEDLYINAKDSTKEPEYPMISTEAGQLASKYLYELILPMLRYNKDIKNHFTRQYSKNPDDFNRDVCEIDNKFAEVNKFLIDLEKVNSQLPGVGGIETARLRSALASYRQFQQAYEASLSSIYAVDNMVKAEIERNYPNDKDLFKNESGAAIFSADYSKAIKSEQDYIENDLSKRVGVPAKSLEAMKESALRRIAVLQKKRDIQEAIKNKFEAEYETKKAQFEQAFNSEKIEMTYDLADNVRKEAQKVYSELYRQNMSPKNNPCRDFTL